MATDADYAIDLTFEHPDEFGDMDALEALEWDQYAGQESSTAIAEQLSYPAMVDDDQYTRALKEHDLHWCQIPLPPGVAPEDGDPFANLTDDELMNIPAALLVHTLQTVANGGLQIIAPQQIPLLATIVHTDEAVRTRDMQITGSIASRDTAWPVIEDPVPDAWFPDIPIGGGTGGPAVRTKTRTVKIAPWTEDMDDPVVRALVTARALVDIQRRPDVGGDSRGLAEIVASAWKLPVAAVEDLVDVSLAPQGPLGRVAADEYRIMPRVFAPPQYLLSISTGAQPTGRLVYDAHAMVNWRRARVAAEATFLFSAQLERLSLLRLALRQRPGDPGGSPRRYGVLQTRIAPGSIWSAAPETFRLPIQRSAERYAPVDLPPRVVEALARYDTVVTPVRLAVATGAQATLTASVVRAMPTTTAESIIAGYALLFRRSAVGLTRGKTAQAALRSHVYNALSTMYRPSIVRLVESCRYIASACADVQLSMTPDVYRHFGRLFMNECSEVRMTVATEAERHGTTLDEWWDDFRSELPGHIQDIAEGTFAWAVGVVWMLINAYGRRWKNLVSALSHAEIRSVTELSMLHGTINPVLGSPARIVSAAKARCAVIAKMFNGRYAAMADVCDVISDLAVAARRGALALRFRIAGRAWALRAEHMRTLTLVVDVDGTRALFTESGVPWRLSTSAYRAYGALRSAIQADTSIPVEWRNALPHHVSTTIAATLSVQGGFRQPDEHQYVSRVMKYYDRISSLGDDIARNLHEAREDIMHTVTKYRNEHAAPVVRQVTTMTGIELTPWIEPTRAQAPEGLRGYYEILLGESASWVEDAAMELPDAAYADLTAGFYRDMLAIEERLAELTAAVDADAAGDTVK